MCLQSSSMPGIVGTDSYEVFSINDGLLRSIVTYDSELLGLLLGGSWHLATTDTWASNPTYSPPNRPYIGDANYT